MLKPHLLPWGFFCLKSYIGLQSKNTYHNSIQTFFIRTFSTAALKSIGPVVAFCSILAGCAGTLIYVNLTHSASKAWDMQTQG